MRTLLSVVQFTVIKQAEAFNFFFFFNIYYYFIIFQRTLFHLQATRTGRTCRARSNTGSTADSQGSLLLTKRSAEVTRRGNLLSPPLLPLLEILGWKRAWLGGSTPRAPDVGR